MVIESNITVRMLSQCIFLNMSERYYFRTLKYGKRITHYIFSLSQHVTEFEQMRNSVCELKWLVSDEK